MMRAAVAVLFLLLLGYVGLIIPCSLRQLQVAKDGSMLLKLSGKATLVHGFEIEKDLKADDELLEEDHLITDHDSTAIVQLLDGSRLVLAPGTHLQFMQLRSNPQKVVRLALFRGRVYGRVAKDSGKTFNLLTKNAIVKITGTDLDLSFDKEQVTTLLQLFEGKAITFNKADLEHPVEISQGNSAAIKAETPAVEVTAALGPAPDFAALESEFTKSFADILLEQAGRNPIEVAKEEFAALFPATGGEPSAAAIPEKDKAQEISSDIKNLQLEMVLYAATTSQMPKEVSALSIGEDSKRDPWGNYYQIEEVSPGKVRLFSLGADGKAGTPDDVKF